MAPIVLWIYGKSGIGKSTLGRSIHSEGTPVLNLDGFVVNLILNNCPKHSILYRIFDLHKTNYLDETWQKVIDQNQINEFLAVFFNEKTGFCPKPDTSLIVEGYMPLLIRHQVFKQLMNNGIHVWIANKVDQPIMLN